MKEMSRRGFIQASATLAAATLAARAVAQQEANTVNVSGETGGTFEAGVAVRDITPEPGVSMWGYSDRSGPATGTLDPLHARALVIRAGGEAVAVVTLDLGRVPMKAPSARIRERAKAAGVANVFMAASHTHHAPMMEAEDAPYAKRIEQLIGDAVEEAAGKLQPARIGVGRAQIDVAHNRRLVKDGKVYMLWRNEERRPTSPVDKEAGIIRVDTADGKPLAVMVNFACHPVVMGPSNLQYSADYVGEMAKLVKEKTGAECLFLQGGCGDINPYLDKTPIDEGGVESMRGTGRACAEAVLGVFEKIETAAPAQPSVKYAMKPVTVGTRWDLNDPEVQQVFKSMYGQLFDKYLADLKGDLAVPLAVLVLNDNLALAGMPGELFVQYQLDLKEDSPIRDTFLCGYASDFHLYFPTVRDAALGGYGGTVATYVGLGAGDKLVTEACIEIGRLAGRLHAVPRPEDFNLVDYEAGQA